jgi:mandelamide amidase
MMASVSPDVKGLFEQVVLPGAPMAIPEAAYVAARDVHRPAMQRLFADTFRQHGVEAILFPTTMIPATLIGEAETVTIGGSAVPFMTAISRNIAPGSTAGLPGLVLPTGMTRGAGLPVSLELDGPAGEDRRLLAIGMAVEVLLGRPTTPALA